MSKLESQSTRFSMNLIMSILQSPRGKPILQEHVKTSANVPSDIGAELLGFLQQEGLLYLQGEKIEANSAQRAMLAVKALELGADNERVCDLLEWREFEKMAALALQTYGYDVAANVRFRQGGRWWEMDVVGWHKPLVVCVDCKHWHHLSLSKMKVAIENQMKRTLAFSESPQASQSGMHCFSWVDAKFLPVVLSLIPVGFKYHDRIPVVPVLQLQNFLTQLPLQLESMRWFPKSSAIRTL